METRKLEVFIRAVDVGNLTQAGDDLGYSQSGVSHMMKSLEDELGMPLLMRSRTGVRPTVAGAQILPLAREIVHREEQMQQELFQLKGLHVGKLCVASFSSVSTYWLPPIIKRFRGAYPDIEIELLIGNIPEIVGWIGEGVADLAFLNRQDISGVDWITLKQDVMMAVLPHGHRLEHARAFPIGEFEREPSIISSLGYEYDVQSLVGSERPQPKIKYSSVDDNAVIAMVESGLGVSILPELVIEGRRDAVIGIPLAPRQYRELGIALPSLEMASPAAKKFIEQTRAMLATMSDE